MKIIVGSIMCFLVLHQAAFSQNAPDTGATALPKHELGISVLYPSLIVLGSAPALNQYFNNLTYRYRFTEKHALRLFAGVGNNSNLNGLGQSTVIVQPGNKRILAYSEVRMPSNCQFGAGYEYYMGHKNVKFVLGADFVYNNQFVKEIFYYAAADSNGYYNTRVDTGAYVKAENFNKLGVDFNVGLRFDINRHWAFNASCIVSSRVYSRRTKTGNSSVYDLSMNGLISDISLFYRF